MEKIESAACGDHFYPLPDKCQQFVDNVHPKIGSLPVTSPCVKSIELVRYIWWITGHHTAIKVTLCSGSVFYLDYGITSISGANRLQRCPQFALPGDRPPWIW